MAPKNRDTSGNGDCSKRRTVGGGDCIKRGMVGDGDCAKRGIGVVSGMPDPWTLVLGVMFGTVGIIALKRGKSEANIPCVLIGLGLIFFPYFVGDATYTLLIGLGLTAGVWFFWSEG